ncbi:Long-chain-fatty-acid--CoA ligase FadD15 [Paraconexibacter sp. AEG42_29]|uniref:Long-chain-fatty-acid--CoA ligase FadD15 n=1 Tax=Paraconexibacter sp. AEG42_29 TaxID=2997339 RepID=A0AAU7AYI2_9ACTN
MSTTDARSDLAYAPPGLSATTMAEAFQLTAAARPDDVALRAFGSGEAHTWAEYDAAVRRLAAGLHALGVRAGDTVGMLLQNRPAFHLVDAAAMHLGAIPFSLYLTSSVVQLEYLLGHARARVLVVEPALLDRVLAADAPTLEHVVVAGEHPGEGRLSLGDVEDLGAADTTFDFDAAWRAIAPDDIATLIYTSGTTGPPKGVEMTHHNLLTVLGSCQDREPFRADGRTVSYLPHAHMADRLIAHYLSMFTGWELTTVADPRTVMAAVAEVRPTWFMGVPRIWEKLRAGLLASLAGKEPAQRAAFESAVELGLEVVRLQQAGKPVPPSLASEHAAADATVLATVRRQLGLDRLDLLLSGAAPLARGVHEFFLALGLPLGEGWGMSETGSLGTVQPPGAIRVGTIGHVMPRGELRISADGEILVRGPHVMPGYRDDPERTAEALDADGWLHTGDIGTIDSDGYVTIVDRKKELIINAAGKNMSPANIEGQLKTASPLIGQACVVGDGRPYNVALLVLDAETAAGHDAAAIPGLVADAVARANEQLSRVEQIKRYALLDSEWLPDGDELTPTMKLKRRAIHEKHAAAIEELYAQAR